MKVSICIPTYNSEKFIAETLNSIAAQTYTDLEVIISDNASTDKTVEIATRYCERYGWNLFQNRDNIGAVNNFNKLIELAKGEYIAIYHADDLYDPAIVEESVKILQKHQEVGFVGSEANIINEKGEIIGAFTRPPKFIDSRKTIMEFDEVLEGIIRHVMLVTPSIMVRREMYQHYGFFLVNSKFGAAIDYELWLRFAYQRKVTILDQKLISYRIHRQQGSEMELRKNIEIPDVVEVYKEYMNKLNNPKIYQKVHQYSQKIVLATAIKQNILGMFSKSDTTLSEISLPSYFILKKILKILNFFQFKIQRFPFFGEKINKRLNR